MHKLFNDSIKRSEFPQKLKPADITSVHEKNDCLDKANYQPVSVLPTLSKTFERIMQKRINDFINDFLSPCLCAYRKVLIPNKHY